MRIFDGPLQKAAARQKPCRVHQFAEQAGCGFTLIELLVVVAIIGVLMSLIFPSLSNAQRAARSLKCMSNLRQLGIAIGSLDKIPPRRRSPNWASNWGSFQGKIWDEFLAEALAQEVTWADDDAPPPQFRADIFRCPLDPGLGIDNRQRRSYAFNGGENRYTNWITPVDLSKPIPLDGIIPADSGAAAGDIVLITDRYNPYSKQPNGDNTFGFAGGSIANRWNFTVDDPQGYIGHPDRTRNALMSGLHVVELSPEELVSQINPRFRYAVRP